MEPAERVAVVTGSTSGIGRAVALALAGDGADVVVHGRDPVRGDEVAAQVRALGRQAQFAAGELRHSPECERLVAAAVDAFGRIDILVNNVAATFSAPTDQTPEAAIDELLAVNVRAPYLLVQAALPHLRQSRGVVINVTGSPAYRGAARSAAYAASKAALHSLTRSWAAEFGPLGIRVNEISPGPIDTPLSRSMLLTDDAARAAVAARVPLRQIGTPEDIASAAVFLASDRAGYINGATLAVDGGVLA